MFAELIVGYVEWSEKMVQTSAPKDARAFALSVTVDENFEKSERLNPAAARHDRSAQQNDDNRGQLGMNNHRHALAARRLPDRDLPRSDGAAPGQELPGRNDRQQADDHEQAELGQKRVAVPVIGRTLLEEEHPQQADHEQRAGGDAEHQIRDLQPPRGRNRQFLLDQRELDRERRHQREGAEMMEEGEQRGHGRDSSLSEPRPSYPTSCYS